MWKMFGWLGRTVAAGLIVSFLAIWTAGYIVNSYVETLLKQYNLPMETQPMALSGVWGTLWGVDSPSGQEKTSLTADSETEATDADADETDPAAEDAFTSTDEQTDVPDAGAGSADPDATVDETQTEAQGDAAADPGAALDGGTAGGLEGEGAEETGSGTGPETQAGAQQEETVITPDELADARDQMTEEDRNKLFAILVSKLPQEEWQTISTYVESGLTESELTNVQQIVAKYLNRDEYDELMEILSKY
jgi:hypothetical protein